MPRALSAARRLAEGDALDTRTRPHADCLHCRRRRPIMGRGLCAGCYRVQRGHYPRVTRPIHYRPRRQHDPDSDADRAAKDARIALYRQQAEAGELDFGAAV